MVLTGLESRELERVLQAFSGKGQACLYDREARMWLSGEVLEALNAGLLEHVAAFHRREPLKQGVSRGELASAWGRGLPAKLVHFLVERLLKAGNLSQDQEFLRLPGHSVSLGTDQADLRARLLALYETGGLTPPNHKDVLETLGVTAKEALPVYKLLSEQNLVRRINEDLYFAVSALDGLKAKVAEYFASHADLGPQDFRELTQLTRKFAIPLLEYLDKEKVTVRVGDKRLARARQA